MVTYPCQAVDGNFSTWMQCFQDTVFLGDPTIVGICVMFIYAAFIYKNGIPGVMALVMGFMISGALYLAGFGVFFSLYAVSFFLISGWIVLVILQRMQII